MKKLIIVLVLMCSAAQANNYNSYLPLKIGNRWIYNCSLGNPYEYSHDRVSINIIDTVIYGGFKYFTYSETIVHLEGNYHFVPDMFLFRGYYPIRIDSINGRLCYLIPGSGCSYSISDVLADSLSARINDSVLVNCTSYPFKYKCIDTTMQKYFKGDDNSNNSWERKYVRGTGFTHSSKLYLNIYGTSQNLVGYVIDGIAWGDTASLVGINQFSSEIPEKFELSQNYPNPFNPVTHFGFRIADFGLVRLTVYDVLGKEVLVLVNEELHAGSYEADWNASDYPSGVYYYKLESGSFTETKKMVLIK